MSLSAITVRSLSKQYLIGSSQPAYKMLGESVANWFRPAAAGLDRKTRREYFWALKDISFEVRHGEVIGIIGHNGAGKSTLLKILSRITEPSRGVADIYGRVGSLLEVGTGFHYELTGRENVYLSGAIMGMKRTDIARRFDEIVAFAGVEKFIDTPVKHYSSGMHLRLAFAVAAHLEPEILLVDEVLAVGDLEFQRKCLNKMENVAGEGRTILFVSHNMGSIKELCKTAIVLKQGEIDFHGPVVEGVQHYSRNVLNAQTAVSTNDNHHGWLRIAVKGQSDTNQILNDQGFEVTAEIRLPVESENPVIHFIMEDSDGNQVVHNYLRLKDTGRKVIAAGTHTVRAVIPPIYLRPGVYTMYLKFIGDAMRVHRAKFVSERIVLDISDNTEMFAGKIYAAILPPVDWTVSQVA